MKICFKCLKEKDLSDFYKHKGMIDGHLNKCKSCTKAEARETHLRNSKNPAWVEKERARHREKYYRLNYREKQKEWDKGKPWIKTTEYTNLSRRLNIKRGYQLHHWNYNDGYLSDVVVMDIRSHKRLHAHLIFDINTRIFSTTSGRILDTKKKHLNYIKSLGLKYANIPAKNNK